MNAWDPTIVKLLCSLWTFVYQKGSCLRIGLCMYGHWLILFESRNVKLVHQISEIIFQSQKSPVSNSHESDFLAAELLPCIGALVIEYLLKKDWFRRLISWLKSTKAGHGSFGGNYYLTRFRVDTFVLCHTEECGSGHGQKSCNQFSQDIRCYIPTS